MWVTLRISGTYPPIEVCLRTRAYATLLLSNLISTVEGGEYRLVLSMRGTDKKLTPLASEVKTGISSLVYEVSHIEKVSNIFALAPHSSVMTNASRFVRSGKSRIKLFKRILRIQKYCEKDSLLSA